MGRSLERIVILLAVPALLAGCLEMAPRSSIAFQPPAERDIRYAAEVALAIKEDRRTEGSEAAANGRLVLPQMPEVWASSPGAAPIGAEGAPKRIELDALGSAAASLDIAPPAGCEGPVAGEGGRGTACERPWPGADPLLRAPFHTAIAPAMGARR